MEREHGDQSQSAGSGATSSSSSTPAHNPFDPSNILGHPPYSSSFPATSIYSPLTHPAAAFSMLAAASRPPLFSAMSPFPGMEAYAMNPFAAQLQAAAMFGIPPPPGYAEALYTQAKLLQEAALSASNNAKPLSSSSKTTAHTTATSSATKSTRAHHAKSHAGKASQRGNASSNHGNNKVVNDAAAAAADRHSNNVVNHCNKNHEDNRLGGSNASRADVAQSASKPLDSRVVVLSQEDSRRRYLGLCDMATTSTTSSASSASIRTNSEAKHSKSKRPSGTPESDDQSDVSSGSLSIDTPSDDSDENDNHHHHHREHHHHQRQHHRPHSDKLDKTGKKLASPSSKKAASNSAARLSREELLNSPLSITDSVTRQHKLAQLADDAGNKATSAATAPSSRDVGRTSSDVLGFSMAESAFTVPTVMARKPGRKTSRKPPVDPFIKEQLKLQRKSYSVEASSATSAVTNGEQKAKKKGRPKSISLPEPSGSQQPAMVKKAVPTMVSLVVPNFKQTLPAMDLSHQAVNAEHSGHSGHSESDDVSDHGCTSADTSMADDCKTVRRGRFEYDIQELNAPLTKGWRREVRITGMGKRGIVGDVFYFAPCGKKLKTFPDVVRYLDKNRVTNLTKTNFTFSTKIKVGLFYEIKPGDGDKFSLLSDAEVADKLAQSKRKKMRQKERMMKKAREWKHGAKHESVEVKLQRRLEQEAADRKKAKDREKLLRNQERLQRQEQSRVEREMRAQQLMEEKERRKQEQESIRMAELVRRAKEREQRRQMLVLSNIERERRRQHMLLVKALECRKRQEERDRQREEKISEKRMSKQRKIEQRTMEYQKARDLNQPMEDMCLTDHKPMPTMKRIPCAQVPGGALADCMMIVEFVHNFKDALSFGAESLPSLESLQLALKNDSEHIEELMCLTCHLLKMAIEDPSFPNPKEAVTAFGTKIIDIALDDDNMSEVFRIFTSARNGKDDSMAGWLAEKPFISLNVTKKAALLAFLCNELLSSKAITAEIDKNIESMANLRRDKWIVEGRLRKLRLLQTRKFPAGQPARVNGNGDDESTQVSTKRHSDDEDDSGNESEAAGSDTASHSAMTEEDDPEPQTAEEMERRIEKMQKQHHNIRDKVFDASHKLRASTYGQDRYERRYWVLPHAGGLYVEGRESAECPHVSQLPVEPDEAPIEAKPPLVRNLENEFDQDDDIPLKILVKKEIESKIVNEEESETKVKKETNAEVIDSQGFPFDSNGKMDVESESKISEDTIMENGLSDSDDDESVDQMADSGSDSMKLAPKKMDFQMACGASDASKSDYEVAIGRDESPTANNAASCTKVVNGLDNEKKSNDSVDSDSQNLVIDLGEDADSAEKSVSGAIVKCEPTAAEADCDHSCLDLTKPQGPLGNGLDLTGDSSGKPCTNSTPTVISSMDIKKENIDVKKTDDTPVSKLESGVNGHIDAKHSISGFMSIDSILDKKLQTPNANCEASVISNFFPFMETGQLSAEQMLRNLSERQLQKPWFSLLPRMPCDEVSITRTHNSLNRQQSPMFLPMPFSSFLGQNVYPAMAAYDPYSTFYSPFKMGGASDSQSSTPHTTSQSPEVTQPEPELKPQPIPEEHQRGWWITTDAEEFKKLLKCLHAQGIMERILQKNLQRHAEYITHSFQTANTEVLKLPPSKEPKPAETKAKPTDEPEKADSVEKSTEDADKSESTTKADIAGATETELETKPEVKVEDAAPAADAYGAYFHCAMADTYNSLLEEIENMETRVYQASLQVKGWKLPPQSQSPPRPPDVTSREEKTYALEQSKERLLGLEKNIERRYLKYPLNKRIQSSTTNILAYCSPSAAGCQAGPSSTPTKSHREEDDQQGEGCTAAGLINWRHAVATARSCSQIHLCISHLAHCIAWEKSIMKVICQLCQHDDNEAELLLCDGCDKGYHTYCFKPKMQSIPDGEWYCYDCVSKATGQSHCVVCGQRGGKMVSCCQCSRHYHAECVDPPVQRCPRKWWCVACDNNKQRIAWRNRKRRSLSQQQEKKETLSPQKASKTETKLDNFFSELDLSPQAKRSRQDSEKSEKEPVVDLSACRAVLSELEKHDKAWPFLKAVNCKQFPQYKQIIKHPMDFGTIKNRLRDSHYKSREDFVTDVLLVFNNCETFNEDNSEVGRAGHEMRRFFLKRWAELCEGL